MENMARKILHLALLALLVAATVFGPAKPSQAFFANWPMCFRFAIIGECQLGPVPGVLLIYWVPTAEIETSPQCGVTLIPWAIPEVAAASVVPCGILGFFGSSHRPESAKQDLHYAEVHVFEYAFDIMEIFPDLFDKLCFVPNTPEPRFLYLSELDLIQWHTGFMDMWRPELLGNLTCAVTPFWTPSCMGTWGPIFPRDGWLEQPSHMAHSAGLAYRGLSQAQEKGLYLGGMTPLDSLQLAYPMMSRCIQIGEPPILWENLMDQPFNQPQHLVWIYWRFVICCIP